MTSITREHENSIRRLAYNTYWEIGYELAVNRDIEFDDMSEVYQFAHEMVRFTREELDIIFDQLEKFELLPRTLEELDYCYEVYKLGAYRGLVDGLTEGGAIKQKET